MSQQAKKKPKMEQILKLVSELSLDEQVELWRKLDAQTWGERWDNLLRRVQERRRGLPCLTEDEIVSEMKAVRREIWAERAQSGS